MYLYEVWINSRSYQGRDPLTYASDEQLSTGQVVEVPLRNIRCLGVVASKTTRKPRIIKKIVRSHPYKLPQNHLRLIGWLTDYYPGPSGSTVGMFLPSKLAKQPPIKKNIDSHSATPNPLPKLTKGQSKVLAALGNLNQPQPVLLHGDTGSGKTRVYIELAKEMLESGKSSIVLTPEIGLVPQLLREFEAQFPGKVVAYHSDMPPARRSTIWQHALGCREPLIAIGPRSALFIPLKNVGLIVVDEAHAKTYKQEQSPHYQTTRVAAKLAQLNNSTLILGSATPLVADYYTFEQKHKPMLRLDEPARTNVKKPTVTIVDLTDRTIAHTGIMSKPLLLALEKNLKSGGQSLLFLNRRGSARIILCQNCGWTALCPRCDVGLVYHSDSRDLRCHICGFSRAIITSCPECKSTDVLYQSPGVKALETTLREHFADAKIRRFDSDNFAHEKLERHYEDIVAGKVDIIIGTQMITKGLDMPKLSVVGILNAESALQIPDFTASEQMYQMLAQVMGRVGRTSTKTSVIIQTYQPESPTLQAAIKNDWPDFYKQEIAERRAFNFPPFCFLLQLTITKPSQTKAREAVNALSAQLRATGNIELRGAGPCFHEKILNKYRWQVIISSSQRTALLEVIRKLPADWRYNIDPNNLL